MPTLQNPRPDHYRSLLSSVLDFAKSSGEAMESSPGVHIGHIAVNHNGNMILLSGFRGYKVRFICVTLVTLPRVPALAGPNLGVTLSQSAVSTCKQSNFPVTSPMCRAPVFLCTMFPYLREVFFP